MKKKKPVVDFKKAITMEYPTEYYVALIFGLFFLVVSVQKLLNPQGFATAVFRGHVMPYPLVNIAALLLMSLEFVAAFAVVFMSQWRRAGLWILVSVLLIYTGCVGINLLRDLNTICGCFGSGARATAISHWTVVRNLSLIIAGLFALR
ncbi:MAG: MauE/DoxX family redox-associated membrane protein [Kiritimatiellales bacterium]